MRKSPSEIVEIAAETGLGEVVDRYRQSVAIEMSFAVTCGALGLFALLFGDNVGKGIGAAASGLAVLFAVPAWLKSRKHLYLCAGGLLTTTGKTTVTSLLTWNDVAHIRIWTTRIYQLGPAEDMQRCVLELKNGKRLNLAKPPYAGGEHLAAAIEQRLATLSYPRRAAEIAETGATVFGPITVTAEGVRDGERFASWSDITRVERGRVRLRIWTGARRPAISRQVRKIPDVNVLMTIASRSGSA
ncbi:DUF6585 family protein [Actinomycetes bacterium KLBMP 9797]